MAAVTATRPAVALVHDYLTQRGGAERVVSVLHRAFPEAPLYTSLYEPTATFPEFAAMDVRVAALDRLPQLRRNHRLALPLLAPQFSATTIDAEVTLCSSSGWAHGTRVTGRKVVYCHNPARWLYQRSDYLGERSSRATQVVLSALAPTLRRWDRRAAASADLYLVNSSVVRERVLLSYGIEAEVVHPPHAVDLGGPVVRPVDAPEPGYLLCVSRLMRYKNVDVLVDAMALLPDAHLVVVGDGPDAAWLRDRAGANVRFVGNVDDAELRWLYENAAALVAASFEDFGLTPVEAAAYARPSVCLRNGGFLDTVVDGATGLLVEELRPGSFAEAMRTALSRRWDEEVIRSHADRFAPERFIARVQEIVAGLR